MLAFCACKKESIYISVDPETVEFTSAQGSVKVKVSANCEWSLAKSATWISLKRNTDEGTLTISVSKNLTTDDREGEVTLRGPEVEAVIKVKQAQLNSVVVDGQPSAQITSESQQVVVNLQSNIGYELVIPADVTWVKKADTKAMVPSSVTLLVDDNTAFTSRTATVNFIAPECQPVPFRITQLGVTMSLSIVVSGVSSYTLPFISNLGAPSVVVWDSNKEEYSGLKTIAITHWPTDITLSSNEIQSIQFQDCVGVDAIDLTKLAK